MIKYLAEVCILVLFFYEVKKMPRKKSSLNKLPKLDTNIKKRLIVCLSFGFVLFFLILVRMGWLQFAQVVHGHNLKEEAIKQQVSNRTITPKRGNIYDSTGNSLALSAEVDTVTLNLTKFNTSKEDLAKAFSDILKIDYTKTLKKLNSDSSSVTIAEKVEHSKVLELEEWLKENKKVLGVSISPEVNRFYPYNNLASSVIGFTGTDGHGLAGLESSLDDILSGTVGKIVSTTDSANGAIPNR